MVLLDPRCLDHLHNRHFGDALENIVGLTFVRGREVKHDYETHAWITWHEFEKPDQRLDPACRCADADNREVKRGSYRGRRGLIARRLV